ncbi:hypothetical protein GCM10011348_46030 [Marinobacterium nitratireducens]|uniref:Uncharacterized protein n=1 Tax=Marinobacterium nitratireducens TaxID=518897 RepID=A0A917ZQU5_9GAMM|nr:hypothetical protein [Marinobacterium nitratireducens]GGO89091.1 hypothetical protein GCM10011348_46030 [Marinobacterium nitratireducens]
MIDIGIFTAGDRVAITRALFEAQSEAAAMDLLKIAQKMGITREDLTETCERLERDLGRGARAAVAWVAKRLERAA